MFVLIVVALTGLVLGVVWWRRRSSGRHTGDGLSAWGRLSDWWGQKKAEHDARVESWEQDTTVRVIPPSAPRPSLPDDDGPPPAAPTAAGNPAGIPPDHAAAHRRISSWEPESDRAHAAFLMAEAKAFAAYGEAFCSYADNLIHGPGLDPAALKGTFELADFFSDVSLAANRALKNFYDRYAQPREFVEGGGVLPRDGRWIGRDG